MAEIVAQGRLNTAGTARESWDPTAKIRQKDNQQPLPRDNCQRSEKRPRTRPGRVHFFKIYRAGRVRDASGARPRPFLPVLAASCVEIPGPQPLGAVLASASTPSRPSLGAVCSRNGRGISTAGRTIEFEETDADRTRTGSGCGRFSQGSSGPAVTRAPGEKWLRPRPVRARFFEFYRAARARSAVGPRRLSFSQGSQAKPASRPRLARATPAPPKPTIAYSPLHARASVL
eukprot:gene10716-biopygen16808